MFEPGDKIVHSRHGAGTVLESRQLIIDGEPREYFCIQMNDERHTLMIPVDKMDEAEIRPAMDDLTLIEKVILTTPTELDDNYRTRQATIREKLKSRNPTKLAQALRDLSWLEHRHKLTNTDTRLRERLTKALAREMALMPHMTVPKARDHIRELISNAIEKHSAEALAVS